MVFIEILKFKWFFNDAGNNSVDNSAVVVDNFDIFVDNFIFLFGNLITSFVSILFRCMIEFLKLSILHRKNFYMKFIINLEVSSCCYFTMRYFEFLEFYFLFICHFLCQLWLIHFFSQLFASSLFYYFFSFIKSTIFFNYWLFFLNVNFLLIYIKNFVFND